MATVSSGKAKVTLPADEQILITREFDAPKHLVYKAWTTPDLVRQWWSGERGERIVNTEVYEGVPGDDYGLNTISLDETDGRTTLTMLCEYSSKEVRDMVIDSGMEGGMQESMDRLEQVARSLR